MKISWHEERTGRTGMIAEQLDLSDTRPQVAEFWMDASPSSKWSDRSAVASVLIFGSYCSGRFHAPYAMSGPVARAITQFSASSTIIPVNVSSEPGGQPETGGIRINIESSGHMRFRSTKGGLQNQRHIKLRVLESDKASGRLFTFDELTVASNAWLHARDNGGLSAQYPYIAMAVLFAADLQASEISIPALAEYTDQDINAMRNLLGAVGIAFHTTPLAALDGASNG